MLLKLFVFSLFLCCNICTVGGRTLSNLEKVTKWTVGIELNGVKICAGAIVETRWVLTLAGCMSQGDLDEYRIVFDDGSKQSVTETRSQGGKMLVVLRLQSALKKKKVDKFKPILGKKVIQLTSESKVESEISFSNTTDEFVMSVAYTVDDGLCSSVDYINGRHMCFKSRENNTECTTTPGVSLTAIDQNKWRLVGFLTSSDENICDGAYRKAIEMAPHYKWIRKILKEVNCDAPGNIENGIAVQTAQAAYAKVGDEAVVMCENGYEANPSSIACLPDGNWEVSACIQVYDSCDISPCINGECINTENAFYCICSPGWKGNNCSEEVKKCDSSPCLKGNCTESENGFTCACNPGWTGCFCSEDVNECDTNPCKNGTCSNLENAFSCSCDPGWTGETCSQDVNDCDNNPCINGNCSNLENAFSCRCDPGWIGETCSKDIDECNPDPCVNANSCVNLENDFSCSCYPGWTGKNCSEDIDECNPDPCVNANSCVNLENDFTCSCYPGWTGKNCSEDVNECDPDPCINGACSNLVNMFSCSCNPGWTGETCSTDIDECGTTPCVNGACSNLVNGYSCDCDFDWGGTNCDQALCNGNVCNSSNHEICYKNASCTCDPRKTLEVGGDRCLDGCSEYLPYYDSSSYTAYYGEGGVFCGIPTFWRQDFSSDEAECLSLCTGGKVETDCAFASYLSGYGVCFMVSAGCPTNYLYRAMTMEPSGGGIMDYEDVTAVFVKQCAVN